MKKAFLYIAAASALFAGCAKETDKKVDENTGKVYTITAVVDNEETRTFTYYDETSGKFQFEWVGGETIAVLPAETVNSPLPFAYAEGGNDVFTYTAAQGEQEYTSFNVAVSPYSAVVPGSTYDSYSLVLSGNYTQGESNAVMVAGTPSGSDGNYRFSFKHAAAIVKVSYSTIPDNAVALVFSTPDQAIVGDWAFDAQSTTPVTIVASGEVNADNNCARVTYDPDLSDTDFYLPIPTGQYQTFIVKLVDEDGETIPGSDKTFVASAPFTVNRAVVVRCPEITIEDTPPSNKYYTRVSSDSDFESGQYLIVNVEKSVAFNGGLDALDVASNIISVDITSDGILSKTETDAASFTISVGSTSSTIKSASGYFIGQTSDANGLKSNKTTAYENTISFDSNGNAVIVSGGAYLRYNSSSGDQRFRYYKSSTYTQQKVIALYKLETVAKTPLATPQNLAVDSSTKTVSWDAVTDAASYTVTVGSVTESVSVNSYTFPGVDDYYDVSVIAVPAADAADKKESDPATLTDACFGNPVLTKPNLVKGEVDETSIEVTWDVDSRATAGYNAKIYDGETKVDEKDVTTGSVTFEGLTQNKQYTIKVFAKAITEGTKPYGASEIATIDIQTDETVTIAKIISDGNTDSVTLPTAIVMAKEGIRAIVSDATGSIFVYQPTGDFEIGDEVKVVGPITTYSNEYQFNKPTVTVLQQGTGTPVYPAENLITTDEPLTAYANGDASTVRVTYATLRGDVDNSGKIVVGNTTVTVYDALTNLKGKTVETVGYLAGWYKSANATVPTIYFVKISAEEYVDPNAPIASVDPTTKTWAYNEVSAQTFDVSVTNCTWDYSPKTLSWATVTADANGITVTPNGEAGESADNTATITVTFTPTNSGYTAPESVDISLTQTKAPAHGITFNPTSNPIELSGTANTPYTITVTSNYAWSAQTTGSGFTVTPTSGAVGTTEVTITPSADGGSSLTDLGSITFSDGTASETFTVKQKEKSSIEKGAAFSYTVTNTTPFFSGTGSGTYGDMDWTLASDNAGYWAKEADNGFHMGSGSKAISYATFTLDYAKYCNDATKKGVAKIVINARAAGTNPKLEVWVGDESLGVKTISNTATDYTYIIEGDLKVGEVKFKISQNSAQKAIYFRSISINPED